MCSVLASILSAAANGQRTVGPGSPKSPSRTGGRGAAETDRQLQGQRETDTDTPTGKERLTTERKKEWKARRKEKKGQKGKKGCAVPPK